MQHLAIVDLASNLAPEPNKWHRFLQILVDADLAAFHALGALEIGELATTHRCLAVNPQIWGLDGTGAFLIAVLLTADDRLEDALQVWEHGSGKTTPNQRSALAIRLQGLLRHNSDDDSRARLEVLLYAFEARPGG